MTVSCLCDLFQPNKPCWKDTLRLLSTTQTFRPGKWSRMSLWWVTVNLSTATNLWMIFLNTSSGSFFYGLSGFRDGVQSGVCWAGHRLEVWSCGVRKVSVLMVLTACSFSLGPRLMRPQISVDGRLDQYKCLQTRQWDFKQQLLVFK